MRASIKKNTNPKKIARIRNPVCGILKLKLLITLVYNSASFQYPPDFIIIYNVKSRAESDNELNIFSFYFK